MAGAAVAVAAAVPAVRKASGVMSRGRQVADQASNVMNAASTVKEEVSSHSSTIGKVGGMISAARKLGGKGKGGSGKPKLSHLIEQHTDIAVPRSNVYNQWTQFEMFPRITKGVESVSQDEDDKTSWTSKIGPSRRNWNGRIVEQVPDERIAWKSEGGAEHQGVVTFHSLDRDLTRVLVQMEYKPKGPIETVGNTLRIQRRRVKRDLRLFKHFLELRGEETGAWRGRIDKDEDLEPRLAGQGSGQEKKGGNGGDGDNRGNGGGRGRETQERPGGRVRAAGGQGARSRNGSGRAGGRSSGSGRRPASAASRGR
jgi:uncharacterized membrane protein